MKKLLCGLLTAALLLSLAACGGKTEAPSDTQPVNAGDAAKVLPAGSGWETLSEDEPFGEYRSVDELLAILNGETPDNEARLSVPEERESVAIAEAEESGETSEDAAAYAGGKNTVTFSDANWEEPSVEFVKMDVEEEGAPAGAGSPGDNDWSTSPYTAGLPQPPGTLGMTDDEDGVFTAMTALSNEGDYDAYVQAVQDAGFNNDAQEEDFSGYGINMRSFSASHADGRSLTLTLNDGSLIIEIAR
ncbi:MAG: hypothetical protein PHO41_00405 [Eubacteriales bacterium]|nr:hypothetical protein [Eubacteriales bacterium]